MTQPSRRATFLPQQLDDGVAVRSATTWKCCDAFLSPVTPRPHPLLLLGPRALRPHWMSGPPADGWRGLQERVDCTIFEGRVKCHNDKSFFIECADVHSIFQKDTWGNPAVHSVRLDEDVFFIVHVSKSNGPQARPAAAHTNTPSQLRFGISNFLLVLVSILRKSIRARARLQAVKREPASLVPGHCG